MTRRRRLGEVASCPACPWRVPCLSRLEADALELLHRSAHAAAAFIPPDPIDYDEPIPYALTDTGRGVVA